MGKLVVNTGSMFSGKTTLLIGQGEKHLKAGQRVVYVKPTLDDRYSKKEIVTHTGEKVEAIRILSDSDICDYRKVVEADVVLIDEVQFFNKRIITGVRKLLKEGIQVYASGLDMDYLGRGFETTKELMAMADKVNKLKAVCEHCGAEANMTRKRMDLLEQKTIVQLGAKDLYYPLCRKCYNGGF